MTKTVDCPTCGRPLGDLDEEGMVGRFHPDTSKNAAVAPKFNTQRYRVLEVLDDLYHATAADIAEELDLSRNQIATRLLELRRGGYVAFVRDDDGHVVRAPTGPSTDGQVQKLTRAGRTALIEGRRSR